MIPDVRYARSGTVAIAYQVVGDGPSTVVYSPHLCTIDGLWRAPHARAFLQALAAEVRLIVFNPRGTGLSDRPRGVTLESRLDDINAVLQATRSERVTLFGVSESANSCALFASTFPERCNGLVLFNPYVTGATDREEGDAWISDMREHWGERAWMTEFAASINPGYVDDPDLLEWFIWMQRAAASPATAAEFARMQVDTNMADVLPTIRVPTTIAYRDSADEGALAFARPILDVETVRLSGDAADPYTGGDELVGTILRRTRGEPDLPIPETVLATLLFTDLTDSTAMATRMGDGAWKDLLALHYADVRRELTRYRGVEVDTAGDGFFCRFDGPAKAIACARAIIEGGRARGIEVRAGVHTGECQLVGEKPAGIAVHIGARVLGAADPGEVLVTSTVRDLVAGSGFTFDDRGEHELKGIAGRWTLYAVTS